MRASADTIDQGVRAVEAVVGGSHPWQAWRRPRPTFYLGDTAFVSHVDRRGRVFLSLPRLREGRLPYLHETAHVFLTSRHMAAVELADSAAWALHSGSPALRDKTDGSHGRCNASVRAL